VYELFTSRPSRPFWEHTGRLKNCVAGVVHLSPEAVLFLKYLVAWFTDVSNEGLTFWNRNYFFNFSTPAYKIMNNTGPKYVRIMKQTAF